MNFNDLGLIPNFSQRNIISDIIVCDESAENSFFDNFQNKLNHIINTFDNNNYLYFLEKSRLFKEQKQVLTYKLNKNIFKEKIVFLPLKYYDGPFFLINKLGQLVYPRMRQAYCYGVLSYDKFIEYLPKCENKLLKLTLNTETDWYFVNNNIHDSVFRFFCNYSDQIILNDNNVVEEEYYKEIPFEIFSYINTMVFETTIDEEGFYDGYKEYVETNCVDASDYEIETESESYNTESEDDNDEKN